MKVEENHLRMEAIRNERMKVRPLVGKRVGLHLER